MNSNRVDLSTGSWTVEGRIDTRSWDWERGKAIPGTGEVYNCDCCGKEHEVWVYVSSKTEQAIVGTSCAKKATHMHNRQYLGANYTTAKCNGAAYTNDLAVFHQVMQYNS